MMSSRDKDGYSASTASSLWQKGDTGHRVPNAE
jgi:hypothetical protein